jgi:hypothetical protein
MIVPKNKLPVQSDNTGIYVFGQIIISILPITNDHFALFLLISITILVVFLFFSMDKFKSFVFFVHKYIDYRIL